MQHEAISGAGRSHTPLRDRAQAQPQARLPVRRSGKAATALAAACMTTLLAGCWGGGGDPGSNGSSGNGTPPRVTGITVLAGDAVASGSTDGAGTAARFNAPRGIALDSAGNLYVADQLNFVIRRITPAGQVSTFAGRAGTSGQLDGSAGDARFSQPMAVALDAGGNLLVTDALRIRRITPSGAVSTVATLPTGRNVDERSLPQFYAGGIAVDGPGNLFVTNGSGTRRITPSGDATPLEGSLTQDNLLGVRDTVMRGVAVGSNNTVYAADLRATISRSDGTSALATFVGSPGLTGSADGSGNAPRFQQVVALSADRDGTLFAADAINNLVRQVTPEGVVSTVAGVAGATTLQAGALPGSLAGLGGIVADRNGERTLYATSGNAVVKIVLP